MVIHVEMRVDAWLRACDAWLWECDHVIAYMYNIVQHSPLLSAALMRASDTCVARYLKPMASKTQAQVVFWNIQI